MKYNNPYMHKVAEEPTTAAVKPAWHSKYNWNMGDWFGGVDWSKPDTYIPRALASILGGSIIGATTKNNWAALAALPLMWGLTGGAKKNWGNIKSDVHNVLDYRTRAAQNFVKNRKPQQVNKDYDSRLSHYKSVRDFASRPGATNEDKQLFINVREVMDHDFSTKRGKYDF